jgi:hypothetical protein
MFATDKELKKAPAKRGTGSSNSRLGTSGVKPGATPLASRSNENDNLVDRVKRERIERQVQREMQHKVILLQKIWRGKYSRKRHFTLLKIETEKKLADIENVAMILSRAKGINFIPPLNIGYDLCRMILFHGIRTVEVSESESSSRHNPPPPSPWFRMV